MISKISTWSSHKAQPRKQKNKTNISQRKQKNNQYFYPTKIIQTNPNQVSNWSMNWLYYCLLYSYIQHQFATGESRDVASYRIMYSRGRGYLPHTRTGVGELGSHVTYVNFFSLCDTTPYIQYLLLPRCSLTHRIVYSRGRDAYRDEMGVGELGQLYIILTGRYQNLYLH